MSMHMVSRSREGLNMTWHYARRQGNIKFGTGLLLAAIGQRGFVACLAPARRCTSFRERAAGGRCGNADRAGVAAELDRP